MIIYMIICNARVCCVCECKVFSRCLGAKPFIIL